MNVGWLLVLLVCALAVYSSIKGLINWGTPTSNMNTLSNQIGTIALLVVALGVGFHAFRKVKLSL